MRAYDPKEFKVVALRDCPVPEQMKAAFIVMIHNHPSGDPTPSEADIKVTRDLIRAGQLMKIEVTDHIIMGMGSPGFCSLRALGYFAGC